MVPWLLIVVLLLVSSFLLWQYHDARNQLSTTQQETKNVNQIRKLLLLPGDENPVTYATVKNAKALSQLVFYQHAENGDVVFYFAREHYLILYRPSTNMIINISSQAVESSSASGK